MDTAGMSRSEMRQAVEAAKGKAETPAPSATAKKTTPAKPAAAPATTPRATTGGKSMGVKGRAAAGGKSMGGKRPPQQPQSKKRKAGKKKADSSDSSSDEDDSSSSSSSSSDDEQEEVAAKMPVKKRGKLTPATPKPDSGDESSDFEPEFDKDFFKNDEDRRWLMGLSEVDREQIITERQEKQAVKREAWELSHRQKKAAARAGASSVKAKEVKDKEPSTPGPAASVARGRATRGEGSSVARDKNADKRAALEDMEARKVEQQQKRQGTRADIMEEDDDDAPRKRQEEGKKMKPPHRQIPQEEKYPKLEKKELEAARVTRDRLIEYAQSPFFGEFVQGLFVRVTLGKDTNGNQRYLVCVVLGVKDKQNEYNVDCPVTRRPLTLRKHLTVSHAGQKKAYPLTVISNKPFEESEVTKWCRNMHKEEEALPDSDELQELKDKLAKNWKEEFVYDEDTVESILQEKEKAKRNRASGNVSIGKFKLQGELEIAWEHYKELQSKGTDQDEQNAAYKKWEELKEQIDIYDEALEKKKVYQESEASRHKVINSRNLSANRTVTKTIDSARNITCTRPYRQTTYFAFGKSGAANKIAEDDRFTGNEEKQQKPVQKVLDPEEMVKLDDDDEEEGEAAAPAQSKAVVGDSHTPEEAASALERAHISLTVQVDVGGQGATKKASGEEGIGSLPLARAPNPLKKPAADATPAASLGAKNRLSLDDYKRRRGLIPTE